MSAVLQCSRLGNEEPQRQDLSAGFSQNRPQLGRIKIIRGGGGGGGGSSGGGGGGGGVSGL